MWGLPAGAGGLTPVTSACPRRRGQCRNREGDGSAEPFSRPEARSGNGMALSAGEAQMKITKVRTHVLEAKLSQPFAYSCAWYDTRTASLVEIETDTGLVGW